MDRVATLCFSMAQGIASSLVCISVALSARAVCVPRPCFGGATGGVDGRNDCVVNSAVEGDRDEKGRWMVARVTAAVTLYCTRS
jgi:hypothetical protein